MMRFYPTELSHKLGVLMLSDPVIFICLET